MHNTTFMMLHLKTLNQSFDTSIDIISRPDVNIDLAALSNAQVTFGGQNPNSSVRWVGFDIPAWKLLLDVMLKRKYF